VFALQLPERTAWIWFLHSDSDRLIVGICEIGGTVVVVVESRVCGTYSVKLLVCIDGFSWSADGFVDAVEIERSGALLVSNSLLICKRQDV
jgi:hypothetical protein